MRAVIMAGGQGTRLRPLTSNQPKPMLPVVNRPMIEHIVNLLRRCGFQEAVVTLQFLPTLISNYFGDGEEWGVSIRYSTEPIPLGRSIQPQPRPRHRARVPRRNPPAGRRKDRALLFHVRPAILRHEDYRGRPPLRRGAWPERGGSTEKGPGRKSPRVCREKRRGLREGVNVARASCPVVRDRGNGFSIHTARGPETTPSASPASGPRCRDLTLAIRGT